MNTVDINLVHIDASTFTNKRKRSHAACIRCHERKVKCDARPPPNGGPCKNCRVAGEHCQSHMDGRTRANSTRESQVTTKRNEIAAVSSISTPAILPSQFFNSGFTDEPIMTQTTASSHDEQNQLPFPNTTPRSRQIDNEVSVASVSKSIVSSTISPLMSNRHLALDRFEAYIEDNLGSYAPSFRTHSVMREHNQDSNTICGLRDLAHPIRHLEVEMGSRSTLDLEQQVTNLDSADMEYLKTKGAFELPPRALQEDLVAAYFREVNPVAPVINRTQFLTDFRNQHITSRLILFAVFTAGAKACRNPLLLDQKGTNHESARKYYKATKALLDTGYEQDKLARIQALLLITWWWDKKDDGGRNMRACAVDAINTAQSLGMHRWDQYPCSNRVLLGLWKRIWWTCFNRDAGVAVSHGLPCMLNGRDFDVHPIVPEDFVEEDGRQFDTQTFSYEKQEVIFFIEQTKIMETLHAILDDYYPRHRLQQATTGLITEREAAVRYNPAIPGVRYPTDVHIHDYQDLSISLIKGWFENVPSSVAYDVDNIQGHQFWPGFLHIFFFTNVCIRFREKSVSKPKDLSGIAERQYCQARGIAAATMISKILRNSRAHGHVLKFTGLLTNSVFNCLIYFLIEGQSLNPDVRKDAQNKYSLCLNVLYEFSQLWVGASIIHRLFEALQANMQLPTTRPGTLFSAHWQSPLPGLRISSEITNSYFKQLLSTDFYYDGGNTDDTSFANSTSAGRFTPQTQYWMSETSPVLASGPGLPDDLDINKWCNFFDLSEV